MLGKILDRVTQTLEVTVDDLLIEGDLAIASAFASGTARPRPDGDPQPLALRVIWVLRRAGAAWRIVRQVGTPKPAA